VQRNSLLNLTGQRYRRRKAAAGLRKSATASHMGMIRARNQCGRVF
jgi:hypothetical protein